MRSRRLTRIAEEGQDHISEIQWYQLDEQNAGRDGEVDIKGWPSINDFRVLKLAFKKAVASTSRRSRLAFKWITEAEQAKSLEDSNDSGDFEELDAKLSKALDGILQGEFKEKVQVKETE